MSSRSRDVILYELNEVPWKIIDYYTERRPNSYLAEILRRGQSITTRHDDSRYGLSPWRTWPSFHSSRYDHNSFDLGQDPTTFRGDPIWNVAEEAGLSVGLFGPLQSWPPRKFAHGGFYVPDTFSKDNQTVPDSVQHFQQFNLAMTRENGFSADAPLNGKTLLLAGVDMARRGLTAKSAVNMGVHLAQELKDRRYKARRPVMQVLPSFDLYWRLHRTYQPRLSIFFTNHVAAMMHRYWGDAVPDYADMYQYSSDEVYKGFIMKAMDYADRQLQRIGEYMTTHPDTLLVIASSMGQGPVEKTFEHQDSGLFVLGDHQALVSKLALPQADQGLTMHPRAALVFRDETCAESAVAPLESIAAEGVGPLFRDVRRKGRTVTFAITYNTSHLDETAAMATAIQYKKASGNGEFTGTAKDFGLFFRPRLGGANTAYHIPEGILIAYGSGVCPDESRKEVDVLDVSPSLLSNVLGVEPSPTMQGMPSLFGQLAR